MTARPPPSSADSRRRTDPSTPNVPCVLALLLLPRMAARNDEPGGSLVGSGLLALGGEAPWGHRMTAARAAACPAAERMVARIHRDAAIVRPPAEPARAAGLADRDVHMVGVRYRADGSHAAAVDEPLLARIEPQDHVFLVAAHDLGIGAGRARNLPALADLEFHIMHDGPDRHVADRRRIAGLHVDTLAGHDGVALAEPLRRQNISEFAVRILHQRDEAGAARV